MMLICFDIVLLLLLYLVVRWFCLGRILFDKKKLIKKDDSLYCILYITILNVVIDSNYAALSFNTMEL